MYLNYANFGMLFFVMSELVGLPSKGATLMSETFPFVG